jgi:hypothetical protein
MLKLIGIAAWAVAHPALYGYHLASLNGVQDVAVCPAVQADVAVRALNLRGCLDVDVSIGWILIPPELKTRSVSLEICSDD